MLIGKKSKIFLLSFIWNLVKIISSLVDLDPKISVWSDKNRRSFIYIQDLRLCTFYLHTLYVHNYVCIEYYLPVTLWISMIVNTIAQARKWDFSCCKKNLSSTENLTLRSIHLRLTKSYLISGKHCPLCKTNSTL